jgi:hypothetical protein
VSFTTAHAATLSTIAAAFDVTAPSVYAEPAEMLADTLRATHPDVSDASLGALLIDVLAVAQAAILGRGYEAGFHTFTMLASLAAVQLTELERAS